MIVYSSNVNLIFGLDDFFDVADILEEIADIDYARQDSNVAGALRVMRTTVFDGNNGDRAGVPDVGIVILGSTPDVNENSIASEAASARAEGIKLIAVGVGDDYDPVALAAIASFSSEVLTVDEFDEISTLLTPLTTYACTSFQETGGF